MIKMIKETAIIEAVLFAAGYAVTYDELAKLLSMNASQVKNLVKDLCEKYDSGSGIQLLMYEKACQFCSREEYSEYIRDILGMRKNAMLSNSALEVLAIVAYHQPVTRAYIEQVRGTDSTYALNTLIEKGLIIAEGKLDVPGKPNLYVTTSDFLRCFGLNSISDMPELE